MTAMPPPDQLRALDAATKFIKKQMTPADLVAIIQYAAAPCRWRRISPPTANGCWALFKP